MQQQMLREMQRKSYHFPLICFVQTQWELFLPQYFPHQRIFFFEKELLSYSLLLADTLTLCFVQEIYKNQKYIFKYHFKILKGANNLRIYLLLLKYLE